MKISDTDAVKICEVTDSDISFAMKKVNRRGNRVHHVIQSEDYENDPDVEVNAVNEQAKDLFMVALAEKSGHTLSDLMAGSYLENGEFDPDVENPSDFYYFPAIRIVAEETSK